MFKVRFLLFREVVCVSKDNALDMHWKMKWCMTSKRKRAPNCVSKVLVSRTMIAKVLVRIIAITKVLVSRLMTGNV